MLVGIMYRRPQLFDDGTLICCVVVYVFKLNDDTCLKLALASNDSRSNIRVAFTNVALIQQLIMATGLGEFRN